MAADSIVPRTTARRPPRGGALDHTLRWFVLKTLQRLEVGCITLQEADRRQSFGDRQSALHATITVCEPHYFRDIALGGTLGAGSGYINGTWQCDDLTTLVRILILNEHVFTGLNRGFGRLTAPLQRWYHRRRANTKRGSRRNIAAHYDLSNEFYRLFLDSTMTYSAGVFERPSATLFEAQVAKLDRICQKLALRSGDHLLEIGTGWGSLALHAAKNYDCRVTTTTISQEQYAFAQERIEAAGLSDRITLLKTDYRDLRGDYDKLVSIEMIEAVGWQYFDRFFQQCKRLVKPDGRMVLQSIVVADRYYERAKHEVDFIKRYVFPGSCIPSVTALTQSLQRTTDFTLRDLEDIGPHYATTLRHWRERFFNQIDHVRALGYSEAFIRLWEFYLCYCEAGFQERTIGDVQLVLDRPLCRSRLPVTQGVTEDATLA
jgi:cyclopropane-fatty-acyl-phospholipid synthase